MVTGALSGSFAIYHKPCCSETCTPLGGTAGFLGRGDSHLHTNTQFIPQLGSLSHLREGWSPAAGEQSLHVWQGGGGPQRLCQPGSGSCKVPSPSREGAVTAAAPAPGCALGAGSRGQVVELLPKSHHRGFFQ